MKNVVVIFIMSLFIIDSCVDRVDFSSPDSVSQLVVDGSITDQPGPYLIKLTRTKKSQDFTATQTVSASKVMISDNLGNSEILTEVLPGYFQTNANGIQGVIGREYILRVETRDGNVYESSPEKINKAGSVNKIYYTFERYQPLVGSPKFQFRIFADMSGEANGDNLFRWKLTGTYQVETHPELRTQTAGQGRIPDPPPCSGYTKKLEQIGPCTCCTCWVNLINTNPLVSNSKLSVDGKFTNIELGLIPVEYWIFFEKVRVEVEQISLTQNTFNYWATIQNQKEGATSLFQPAIGKPVSNIRLLTGSGGVQGLFSAYSSARKVIFIKPGDIPVGLSAIPDAPPPIAESCLAAFQFASTNKPIDW